MDIPFPPNAWRPSRPHAADSPPPDLPALITLLGLETQTIARHPYDPSSWLRRSRTLSALGYPELAVGDAHKAAVLCRQLMRDLDHRPNFRLGFRGGFWMGEDEDGGGGEEERERQARYFGGTLLDRAEGQLRDNLSFSPNRREGKCVLLGIYPWMKREWVWRGEEVLETANRELDAAAAGTCVVRRYAFGEGIGPRDGQDLLGMFATRNINEGEVVLVDVTRAWGCNGPGTDGTTVNLFGGSGCLNPIHPNTPEEDISQDLCWVRNRSGRKACDALVKCRLLQCSIIDGAEHPLDHPLIARLTPLLRRKKYTTFSLENDIAILDDALQQFGIDIFANLNYDTWTLFVLMARTDNNCWSDPNTAGMNGLFALFNHSCEENVEWQIGDLDDHRTMTMSATRNIKKGEQLFVCYDAFMKGQPLEKRRKRFWRWLEGPCQCLRCMREEAELGADESKNNSFSSSGPWDTETKPIFPEDVENKRSS